MTLSPKSMKVFRWREGVFLDLEGGMVWECGPGRPKINPKSGSLARSIYRFYINSQIRSGSPAPPGLTSLSCLPEVHSSLLIS